VEKLLPVLFIAVFAVSRIPHLLPPNFSVAYAFAFCAGVYFRGAMAWWLPLGGDARNGHRIEFLLPECEPGQQRLVRIQFGKSGF